MIEATPETKEAVPETIEAYPEMKEVLRQYTYLLSHLKCDAGDLKLLNTIGSTFAVTLTGQNNDCMNGAKLMAFARMLYGADRCEHYRPLAIQAHYAYTLHGKPFTVIPHFSHELMDTLFTLVSVIK